MYRISRGSQSEPPSPLIAAPLHKARRITRTMAQACRQSVWCLLDEERLLLILAAVSKLSGRVDDGGAALPKPERERPRSSLSW